MPRRPGAPGGFFWAKNVRCYHNLTFQAPWEAAGRKDRLPFVWRVWVYGIVRQPPWARFVPGWPHAAHAAKPPPVGATGAPGTAPERRRIPARCAETPAIDFLARGSYTPRRFKPHDAHRGRPGAPGGLFLAKNVRLYHNLMFFTPWGAAGRQNSLSFFDEFGCTILAPGKK